MKNLGILGKVAGAAAVMLGLAAVPASAIPITYKFNGTFTDGQTISGDFSLNVYGYPTAPTSLTTTTGLFSGYTYALPGDPSAEPSPTVLVLSSPNYNRYLYLDFTNPLSLGATDLLIAGSSFECDAYGSTTYACTGGRNKVRYFESGSATPVPEPGTIFIFGVGLMTLVTMAALGRSKRHTTA